MKMRGKIHITDGTINKIWNKDKPLPEGFYKGYSETSRQKMREAKLNKPGANRNKLWWHDPITGESVMRTIQEKIAMNKEDYERFKPGRYLSPKSKRVGKLTEKVMEIVDEAIENQDDKELINEINIRYLVAGYLSGLVKHLRGVDDYTRLKYVVYLCDGHSELVKLSNESKLKLGLLIISFSEVNRSRPSRLNPHPREIVWISTEKGVSRKVARVSYSWTVDDSGNGKLEEIPEKVAKAQFIGNKVMFSKKFNRTKQTTYSIFNYIQEQKKERKRLKEEKLSRLRHKREMKEIYRKRKLNIPLSSYENYLLDMEEFSQRVHTEENFDALAEFVKITNAYA